MKINKIVNIQFILFITLLLMVQAAMAQSSIKGVVSDSTETTTLPGAHAILYRSDSTQAGVSTTSIEGKFEMNDLSYGQYFLEISYIGYATDRQSITLTREYPSHDFGNIQLKTTAWIIDEVLIIGKRIPMVVKGDSVEYNVDAYKIGSNEAVTNLLRKMPGIDIDEEGNVTANGRKVNQVYVDGKTFFGNDVKTAISALNSEVIDKVQTFENRSRLSRFTGQKTGTEKMGLNFVLKDEGRQLFGKLTAGYGSDDHYLAKGNVTKFKNKTRITLTGQSDDVSARGINENSKAGINANTELGKFDIDLSYGFDQRKNTTTLTTDRQNFVEGQILKTLTDNETTNKNSTHNVNAPLSG